MLQEIKPYEYSNRYEISNPRKTDYIVISKGKSILLKKDEDGIVFPTFIDVSNFARVSELSFTYLFEISGFKFYKSSLECESALIEKGFEYFQQSKLLTESPRWLAFSAITAIDLSSWYDDNVFCPRCGHRLKADTKERMLFCEECHNMIYPRINPVAIVAVINGDKLLLTQYVGKTNVKRYALVAGFSEIGETIEDTVRREVFEETGLRVKNIRFYKSQPWALSSSLLFGFICELDGDDAITIQQDELGFAAWFKKEEIPDNTHLEALTQEMIVYVKNNCLG